MCRRNISTDVFFLLRISQFIYSTWIAHIFNLKSLSEYKWGKRKKTTYSAFITSFCQLYPVNPTIFHFSIRWSSHTMYFSLKMWLLRNENESKSQCQMFPFVLFFAVILNRILDIVTAVAVSNLLESLNPTL